MGLVDFWMFAGALAVAYLVPGPDMVLILQTGLLRGRRHALAVAAGLAVARATHVLLAAAGLAALLRTMPAAFDASEVRAEASSFAPERVRTWRSLNSSVAASRNAVAFAAITCMSGPPW